MTVRIISRPAILQFAQKHPNALVPLMNWYRITRKAKWRSLGQALLCGGEGILEFLVDGTALGA